MRVCELMDKMFLCCARMEERGGGLLKEMRVKLANYRKEMQRFRSRRDTAGVQRYNEV